MMTFAESLRYLNSFLNLERITFTPGHRLWNLRRMKILLKWFPQTDFLPILIAGTKGKGSTGYFLESILHESRISCGFYSSPHLEDPRERIRVRGRMVSKRVWIRGVEQIRRGLTGRKLPAGAGDFTYFEIMTLLAVLIFRREKIRIGIFEVGMGGRLDATNALAAPLVLLTPVHLDHEAFLGSTIAKIAAEKAAVIRRGARVIMSPQHADAERVIRKTVRRQRAVLYPVRPLQKLHPGLEGDYQSVNAASALKAAELLCAEYGLVIPPAAVKKGLSARSWPGRMEIFAGCPAFLLDAAHNPVSIQALVRNLKKRHAPGRCLAVFGTARDKKSDLMLRHLSRFFSDIILTRAANPRSRETAELMVQARGLFRTVWPAGSSRQALALARSLGKRYDRVVVTGSFYLLGEIRPLLRRKGGF